MRSGGALLLIATLAACGSPTSARAPQPRPPLRQPAAAEAPPPFKGVVARFALANDGRETLAPRVVTFGQILLQGQVRPDSALALRLGGASAPCQMDAKALYPDGSVRHALLTILTPAMAPGRSLEGVLETTGGRAPRTDSVRSPAPPLQLAVRFDGGPASGRTFTLDLPRLAQSAAAGKARPWLDGPLASERRYSAHVAQGLDVAFDVWSPARGAPRVDAIFHNDLAQNAAIATETYDVELRLGGAIAYRAAGVRHHPYATWRATVGGEPSQPRIVPDLDALVAAGAVPRYLRFRPDPGSAEALHRLAFADVRPLSPAGVTPAMPSTGQRPDLGPLPAWAVFYLLDPSQRNRETLFADADAAGSVPWHARDGRTDDAIDIDRNPQVWLDDRGRAIPGVLNRRYARPDTPWQPETAHQPSLTYLPYLLTGSRYYRDELAMQAAYDLLSMNPEYRGGADGTLLGEQVRGVAWSLRTLANAAYILPADDPLRPLFQAKLEGNLRAIVRQAVRNPQLKAAGELQGYLPGPYAVEGSVPPWQQDYLVMVLAWIDAMGVHQARPTLAWMVNFVAGRFTNADRGYDPIYGTPYYLFVADPRTKAPLGTWAAAFKTTFDPKTKPVTTLDYPDWGGGYAALARASLASLIDTTGSPQAAAAYRFVEAHTPRMADSYPHEPAFAITARALQAPP